jgi:hypothetical protein
VDREGENESDLLCKTMTFIAWSVPALFALHAMCTHWVGVPFWDEWETPGAQLAHYCRGALGWADLFGQHNEHRLFFPRLIWLPLAIAAGWDVRYEMVFTFALVCLGAVGLAKLAKVCGLSKSTGVIFSAILSLLLFSPREYETFLVGTQGQTFVPSIALVFALLINVSNISLGRKTIANAFLALISTYSFGNGMLVWFFGFPIGAATTQRRTRLVWSFVYVAIATASICLYFVGYRHPPLAPPIVSPLTHAGVFAQFVLVWIGSLFSVTAPATLGLVLLTLFAGLTAVAWRQVTRIGDWQRHYPWLTLGGYALFSAAIAAVARLGFDYSMAGDSRYTTFSSFFYIALVGLTFSVSRTAIGARVTGIGIFAAVLALWTFTLGPERRFVRADRVLRKHLELIVRWSDAIPRNPELRLVSPYSPEETIATIRAVASLHILRPRLVSRAVVTRLQNLPSAMNDCAGVLDEVFINASGDFMCKGSARIPNDNRPADCVVLVFENEEGTWQPFSVLETEPGRETFSRTVPTPALPRAVMIRACAVDLANEQVFPLRGAIRLPASP